MIFDAQARMTRNLVGDSGNEAPTHSICLVACAPDCADANDRLRSQPKYVTRGRSILRLAIGYYLRHHYRAIPKLVAGLESLTLTNAKQVA